jgi:hypothetical protein
VRFEFGAQRGLQFSPMLIKRADYSIKISKAIVGVLLLVIGYTFWPQSAAGGKPVTEQFANNVGTSKPGRY